MEHMRHKNLPGTTEARLLEQTHCHVLAMMFAGHETTASTMLFAVKYISENPEVLAALQAEHDVIRESKDKDAVSGLTWDDFKKMNLTQHVITETIRLCNPIGLLWLETKDDVPMQGYVAPNGWKVICAIREAQHDPGNYENPKQFNPWHHGQPHHSFCHPIRRYLHSTAQQRGCFSTLQQNLNPANRLPFFGFGGGARLCLGADLAWLEILVFLHQLVTKFQWELCGEDVESYFPLPKLSKGLQINVHKHIKSDPIPSAC
ncbi:unnamed protein product [Sphagnum troendelagicum]|uniref:Cytochrome P450 n=1 Tax=Sphagnum troendelagicum TaxID=128251 RepID=A0ABP0UK70_9BRYO